MSWRHTWRVFDDGRLSTAGVQLDITVTHGDLSKLSVYVVAPSGENATVSVSVAAPLWGDRAREPTAI